VNIDLGRSTSGFLYLGLFIVGGFLLNLLVLVLLQVAS
jgi:hypothetical protein